jgi:pimeloyl-ACP methyl ester carboxylesterase
MVNGWVHRAGAGAPKAIARLEPRPRLDRYRRRAGDPALSQGDQGARARFPVAAAGAPLSALEALGRWEARIGQQARRLHFPQSYFTPSAKIVAQQFQAAGEGWEAPGHGSYARLPKLRIRTLIMAGLQDVIVPARNALILHARIAHSALVRYRDAGHAFLFQEPLAVARRVLRTR